jgi:ligand-binding sensor domain-containing protein
MYRLPANPPATKSVWKICTIFLSLLSQAALSQSLNFRQYSVDDGLPFVQVNTIYQDNSGNLWTGGYGGLSRFDGIHFTNFSPRDGLPNHFVRSITQDSRGDLWVGTIGGAARYSGGRFETFSTRDGLPDENVRCILKDERNVLWFGTDRGVARYDGAKFTSLITAGAPDTIINCFYQEPNTAKIWIGTANGVYLYDNGTFRHFTFFPLFDQNVNSITRDREGKILAGTSDGLLRFTEGVFKLLFTPNEFEMPGVNAMITDNEGMVWIGANNGLFSWSGQTFRHYSVSPDPNADDVLSLFLDYENSIWLGTHAGLYRFRGEGFISYGKAEGLESNFIFGITEDEYGNIWACSQSHGIYKHNPSDKSFVNYDRMQGLASSHTNACMTMPGNEIYVGTDRGLSVISPAGKITNYTRRDGLHSDTINCMMTDRKGRTWFAGAKGITLFENGVFTPFINNINQRKYDTWCITEDRNGLIWLGTYQGGLYTFDGKTFADGALRTGLKVDDIFGISEDRNGTLYFGTLDGVFIYDGKTIDSLTQSDGLSSDLVYCQLMDKEAKFLWVGTNQGINRFDVENYGRTGEKTIYSFGKEEGFSGVESNTNGAYISRDGMMWFGTVNGLIRFSPQDFRRNTAYTKTSITAIRLFYNDTLLVSPVELSYDENNISFEYVGICLTNPAKVRYRYMLSGAEEAWSPPTKERVARYSNLPPGTYTFKVISSNNEGLWNTEPAVFSFTIGAPVWKRPWFWLLLTAGSVLILSVTIVVRIRQIKTRERIESETQVAMARNELKALRAQMNPHFVFNSLNSIQHFILTNKSADAGKYLNKFARLMRVILNNSEKSLITVREEIEYLQLYLELEEMRFENKFRYKITVDDEVDMDYIELPAMLLQPYVENAILHGLTPKKEMGHLEVRIRLQGNTLVCSIIDDGIGREKARDMRKLSNRKDHQSLGMKITHDRLELINRLHGSQLSLTITDLQHEDKTPAGTRVDIFVPVS